MLFPLFQFALPLPELQFLPPGRVELFGAFLPAVLQILQLDPERFFRLFLRLLLAPGAVLRPLCLECPLLRVEGRRAFRVFLTDILLALGPEFFLDIVREGLCEGDLVPALWTGDVL